MLSNSSKNKYSWFSGAGLGAAFLMANSSIGPGFLTQTTVFTFQLLSSFGFVILVSLLLDIGAQLNTWRIITMSELRAQDISNQLLPGWGYCISFLVVAGGFAFNIANIAGCGLGLNVLTGIDFKIGAATSCVVALLLFWYREIGPMLDRFTRVAGMAKIVLTLIIAIAAHPPIVQAVHHTFVPVTISTQAIVTIVGGTVGGYITFSGAHRLMDAGIKGKEQLHKTDRSAMAGILISGLMRFILFLAVLGAVQLGCIPDQNNPAASVFGFVAGNVGLRIFGVVLWAAALSSVIGAAYTSISFLKTFHPFIARHERAFISVFIVLSTLFFVAVGKPAQLLLLAGMINGLILPIALGTLLIAGNKSSLMKGYRHPLWMQLAGGIVVVVMGWMGIGAVQEWLNGTLFK
ncbi:MAG: NRAMP family divalent metal transporter [Sediminibacterium sp.]